MSNTKILIYDINKDPIIEGQLFEFYYNDGNLKRTFKLKGYFSWHQDELRYEVIIVDDDMYTCLSYDYQTMSAFKLI